jgi:hypothetical protein
MMNQAWTAFATGAVMAVAAIVVYAVLKNTVELANGMVRGAMARMGYGTADSLTKLANEFQAMAAQRAYEEDSARESSRKERKRAAEWYTERLRMGVRAIDDAAIETHRQGDERTARQAIAVGRELKRIAFLLEHEHDPEGVCLLCSARVKLGAKHECPLRARPWPPSDTAAATFREEDAP